MTPQTDTREARGSHATARAAFGVVLALTLALAGCADSDPTLLDASDFEGAEEEHYERPWALPGGSWCLGVYASVSWDSPGSFLLLDDGRTEVGAGVVWDNGSTFPSVERAARGCVEHAEEEPLLVAEPLRGLEEGAVGWRFVEGEPGVLGEMDEGRWGEFAMIQLDATNVLAVGFETDQAEAPVEINELFRLAREGLEGVDLDD